VDVLSNFRWQRIKFVITTFAHHFFDGEVGLDGGSVEGEALVVIGVNNHYFLWYFALVNRVRAQARFLQQEP
jgi:hypothetical protein